MADILRSEIVKEGLLYDSLRSGNVRCRLCERRCTISDGERGFCNTRMNIGGVLYTLTYGNLSALESRPIEIKPFFHFWPGSTAITFSTWSCNFTCPWCQNWHLSRRVPDPLKDKYTPPERVIKRAIKHGDQGTCVSFNEPLLLFEYSIDVFRLARLENLYNTYVSNGYMTLEALKLLKEAGLDALKIDVKGTEESYRRYNSASVDVVWRNAREAKNLGIHVEIVCLLVTGVSDDESTIEEIVERHLKELGDEVPIHFTRYFPAYKYREPPTPIEVLEKAYMIAKSAGIKYPYIGNVPGHPFENTYCPECNELLIRRWGMYVVEFRIRDGKCPRCGTEIPVIYPNRKP